MKLKKLYSDPKIFDPITFQPGVNIILGERSDVNKTNGVGKSVCIEFINFCLLKDKVHSRVTLIDEATLPKETSISLDLEINDEPITICRSIGSEDKPLITYQGKSTIYSNLADSLNFLNSLIANSETKNTAIPSFREMMGPLIRDEKSEFQNILQCYDINIKSPVNLTPHLYFLHLDLSMYKEIKDIITEITKSTDYIKKIKSNIADIYPGRTLESTRSELNSLQDELEKMKTSIEEFRTLESFEIHQDEIIRLETTLDNLKVRQQSLKSQIGRIEKAPRFEVVDTDEIAILYDQFKEGLGTHLKKTVDQVQEFKKKIDNFQSKILSDKVQSLKSELSDVTTELKSTDDKLSEKLKLIGHEGILKSLKNSLSIYDQKSSAAAKLRSLFNELEGEEKTKKRLSGDKSLKIIEYDFEIEQRDDIIRSFENTILDIHFSLMGNKKASFNVKTEDKANKKEFVLIDLRIDDDGSHSVDRTKVFIYDMALLTNVHTRKRHPKMLIHDNIFDVDQDTLIKSLNFLESIKDKNSFQYILTLNRDKIENEESLNLIKLNIEDCKIESFSKQKRFLKKQYQEKGK